MTIPITEQRLAEIEGPFKDGDDEEAILCELTDAAASSSARWTPVASGSTTCAWLSCG